jgi:putative flippase GtrA|tara:strand:- start:198 stop:581 length:384 start_codon:yes stop_codon:yes gene_type:complete
MKIIDFFEIYKFIIIGIIAVSIDAFVYYLLGNFEFFSYEISKRISFICGAVFAFFFNRSYVFQIKHKNIGQILGFTILYLISFLCNAFSHDFVLNKLDIPAVAFIFATAISTIINYLGQKFIIFKKI